MRGGDVARAASEVFAAEVADYLRREPPQLPSRYLYDALGSALFDAIGHLPWYRITRAERALLAACTPQVLRPLRRPLSMAELGCGNGEKLAEVIGGAGEPIRLVNLVDISAAALQKARDRLAALPVDDLVAHQGTYEEGLDRIARSRRPDGSLLVLFLGSNLGNFDPPAARQLLAAVREALQPGDALLLGTDLVKPESDLVRAYDDPLGVTAAFNLNLLERINRELGGTFDLEGFAHRAVWNRDERRVEMHLVSRRAQAVRVPGAGLDLTFAPGEWIWTESSYKYDPAGVVDEGRAAGFAGAEQWVDERDGFALTRFDA